MQHSTHGLHVLAAALGLPGAIFVVPSANSSFCDQVRRDVVGCTKVVKAKRRMTVDRL